MNTKHSVATDQFKVCEQMQIAKHINIILMIALFCGVAIPTPLEAKSIKFCTDRQGNTIYTDNACPPGFTRKTVSNVASPKVIEEAPVEVVEEEEISWDKYQISLEQVEMGWQLVKDGSAQGAVIYPRLKFVVKNGGVSEVSRLKIIMSFTDESGVFLGDTHKYIKRIEPNKNSEQTILSPTRGYSYDERNDHNDYKKNIIIATKLAVDITARYMGEKKHLVTLDFSSDSLQ